MVNIHPNYVTPSVPSTADLVQAAMYARMQEAYTRLKSRGISDSLARVATAEMTASGTKPDAVLGIACEIWKDEHPYGIRGEDRDSSLKGNKNDQNFSKGPHGAAAQSTAATLASLLNNDPQNQTNAAAAREVSDSFFSYVERCDRVIFSDLQTIHVSSASLRHEINQATTELHGDKPQANAVVADAINLEKEEGKTGDATLGNFRQKETYWANHDQTLIGFRKNGDWKNYHRQMKLLRLQELHPELRGKTLNTIDGKAKQDCDAHADSCRVTQDALLGQEAGEKMGFHFLRDMERNHNESDLSHTLKDLSPRKPHNPNRRDASLHPALPLSGTDPASGNTSATKLDPALQTASASKTNPNADLAVAAKPKTMSPSMTVV